jgi:hypothetical protein
VLRPQSLLHNRQGPLVKGFGPRVLALLVVEPRQVVETLGHVRVLRPQGLFSDRQRSLQKGLDVGITTTPAQVNASLVEQSRSLRKFENPVIDKLSASMRLEGEAVRSHAS